MNKNISTAIIFYTVSSSEAYLKLYKRIYLFITINYLINYVIVCIQINDIYYYRCIIL